MVRYGVIGLVVMLLAATALGEATFYSERAAFTAANAGNALYGIEDFEENDLAPNSVGTIAGELRYDVPTTCFPSGLSLADLGVGTDDIYNIALLSEGFRGLTSDVVGSAAFSMATYLNEYAGDKVAMGMDVYELMGGAPVDISVYDVHGNLLGSFVTAATTSTVPTFFGVVADVPIGQVRLVGRGDGAELIDNVETWIVPEPATLSLLGLAVLMLRRR